MPVVHGDDDARLEQTDHPPHAGSSAAPPPTGTISTSTSPMSSSSISDCAGIFTDVAHVADGEIAEVEEKGHVALGDILAIAAVVGGQPGHEDIFTSYSPGPESTFVFAGDAPPRCGQGGRG